MTIKERILIFVDYKKISVSQFEKASNLSNGYISNMRKNFSAEKLSYVLKAFPDLNRDWLIYGEGDMLISKQSNKVAPIKDDELEKMKEELAFLRGQIASLEKQNKELLEKLFSK